MIRDIWQFQCIWQVSQHFWRTYKFCKLILNTLVSEVITWASKPINPGIKLYPFYLFSSQRFHEIQLPAIPETKLFYQSKGRLWGFFLNVKHHFLFDISDFYWCFKELEARKCHEKSAASLPLKYMRLF